MRTVTVTFTDGDTLTTSINGTDQEITAYYLNHTFNLGVVADRIVQATHVHIWKDPTP